MTNVLKRVNLPTLILLFLYAAAVVFHFECLKTESEFPLISTDEVQYVSVGENIRLGNGFTTRGEFHSGIPPLYPLFVAFAHSLGSDTRLSALVLSCLTVCLAIFPAYGLAWLVGLSDTNCYVLAVAAAMLPHTLWAGLYMTETLNYPLFLGAFYTFARWVEAPTRNRSIAGGLLLAAMLLTKIAAFSFAAGILITLAILFVRSRPAHAAWIFGIPLITQLAWQAFKYSHGAAGFGMYGHAFADSGLPQFTMRMMAVYLADFLFAPGLVLAVPLFLWFRENRQRRFPLSVLLASTLLSQMIVQGAVGAGITGVLQERHLFYSFPIIAIFAVAGMEAIVRGSLTVKLAFLSVPVALLGAMLFLYPFAYNPVLDVPWTSAMGSSAWETAYKFSRLRLGVFSLGLTAVTAVGLLQTRRIHIAASFFLLAFNCALFASSTKEMTELSTYGRIDVSGIMRWLKTTPLRAHDRLIVAGNMAYYQEASRTTPWDQFYIDWEGRLGLNDFTVFQIEILGRYDVRIARNPNQLAQLARPGEYLLTATRMTNLDLVSYSDPLYLYRVPQASSEKPRPLYTFAITANELYVWPPGSPPEKETGKVVGGRVDLPPGRYRATLYLKSDPSEGLTAMVIKHEDKTEIFQQEITGSRTDFEFSADGAALRFRLGGPGFRHTGFQELVIQYLRASP
jgi:hypothetical protein